ncbi:MAG: dTDP-4-amino-4,6-dideoxygalactose transaminase [Bdellovibrionota bacterium]
MSDSNVPFNRPPILGRELEYLKEALTRRHLSGDGPFTKKCHEWLEKNLKTPAALLTHSCTAALEMSAMLADLKSGDEVIMPSYTFVSTANAVVLRGATPVFVDCRPDTMNVDETKIEAAITPKTKAIMPVHYAGVGCEMDTILEIAKRHSLLVMEDAAQGLMADYKGKALGTIGHLGALSFHETKNVVSGEGGALLVNDESMIDRAHILREKGTNRRQFLKGQVDKDTWQDIGSSYLPSELIAAVLCAQLESAKEITDARLKVWNVYHREMKTLEDRGRIVRNVVPSHCKANAHIYFLFAASPEERSKLTDHLKSKGISPTSHYVPLHAAPGGKRFGRAHGNLSVTTDRADRLLRLPMWAEMTESDTTRVIEAVKGFYQD